MKDQVTLMLRLQTWQLHYRKFFNKAYKAPQWQCVSQDLKTGGLFFGTQRDPDRDMQPWRDFVKSVYQLTIGNSKNSVSHVLFLSKIPNWLCKVLHQGSAPPTVKITENYSSDKLVDDKRVYRAI